MVPIEGYPQLGDLCLLDGDKILESCCSKLIVKVNITTDFHGADISYGIKDSNNNKVMDGDGFANSATCTDTQCIDSSSYMMHLKTVYVVTMVEAAFLLW